MGLVRDASAVNPGMFISLPPILISTSAIRATTYPSDSASSLHNHSKLVHMKPTCITRAGVGWALVTTQILAARRAAGGARKDFILRRDSTNRSLPVSVG
jgi:hypothetical protein